MRTRPCLTTCPQVLNDTTYPGRDVIADFKKHRCVEYYKMFTEFARDYSGTRFSAQMDHVDFFLMSSSSRTNRQKFKMADKVDEIQNGRLPPTPLSLAVGTIIFGFAAPNMV